MRSYPDFVDDVSFYHMDNDKSRLEQQEAMLKNLKSVFQITNQTYRDLQAIVHDCLSAGREIFAMQTGIVSCIEGQNYKVMDVVSSDDFIKRGDNFALAGTYCHEVYNSRSVLGFPHVGSLEFMLDHPVYVNLKLEAYLSAPIEVDGDLYGTLNFTSAKKREFGFSEHERDLISLMANAIGNFISLRERDEKLRATNSQLKKFIGFVAHDLRNPLGAIQTMAKMGLKAETPPSRIPLLFDRVKVSSTLALEFVHNILELAALGTGKITPKLQEVKLIDALQNTLHQIEDLCESTAISIQFDFKKETSINVDNGLINQIFANLLTNAIKYSPMNSEIVIKCEGVSDTKIIAIINNIDEQVDTLESGGQRYRSIGFGLDIVSEILFALNSKLRIEKKNNQFIASFALKE